MIALIFIAIFIFEPFRSEPPAPNVTAGGKDIPTTQGSYCWNGLLFSQCVDFIYSTPLEMAKEHKPTKVSPNETIKIEFKKDPASGTLEVEQWIGENDIKKVEINDDSIKVPDEKGIYVYHIMARWEQGDGNYAFSIEVR